LLLTLTVSFFGSGGVCSSVTTQLTAALAIVSKALSRAASSSAW